MATRDKRVQMDAGPRIGKIAREQKVWWECSECKRTVKSDSQYCDLCGVKFEGQRDA